MPDRSNGGDWRDVDAQADSGDFADYLEAASAEEQVQRYKQRSHALLDPEPGDRVLDAGCGLGHDVLMLAERVTPEGEVVGIDYSQDMIRRAREAAEETPAVTFATGSILDIEYPRDAFDASRADRVLQHLEDPSVAIDELKRVTKPGGRVGLTDTAWESMLLDAPGGKPPHQFLDLKYQDAVNPEMGRQLYRFATEAGLTEIDIDPVLFYATSFDAVRELTRLDPWIDRMQDAGIVSEETVENWLDRLEDADDSGRFFASLAGFTVAGTVPE